MTKKSNIIENLIGLCISLFAFIIYSFTVSRTVSFIDSGELATACYTLGICHPTGYPLFTLVGWIFSHLPLGLRTIYQLNLMSGFFSAAALFFIFKLLYFVIENLSFNSKKVSTVNAGGDERIRILVSSVIGTITLAFSATYWSQSTSIEVYSLHVFLISIILYLYVKSIFTEQKTINNHSSNSERWKLLLLFSYLLGVSFTNHMTTILLAPAVIYLYFWKFRFQLSSLKRILILSLPFILGFSMQFYLPVRANENPILNWGNPVDFEKWFWHFSGKVYRVWIFSSTESAAKQMNYFITNLSGEFVYFPIVIAFAGILFLFKYSKQLFTFTLLLFVFCIFYSINYDIHDIDSYFLLAYLTISIWVGIGSFYLLKYTRLKFKLFHCIIISIAIVALFIGVQFRKIDQGSNKIVENYTNDMFNSVEENSIIISYQWDYFISAAYYLQIVEKVRTDLVIIDKELLRRSWYFNQLRNRYSWLIDQMHPELNQFLAELNKFEHNLPYRGEVIEYHYQKIIKKIIDGNITTRNIYITPEIEDQYIQGYYKTPSGLCFRLGKSFTKEKLKEVEYKYIQPDFKNTYTEGIKNLYARSFLNYGLYYRAIGNEYEAEKYFNNASKIQSDLSVGTAKR
ncbi:MAG: DUF2723 domain-containing protein [Ignavibacteriales bacterium]|nr:DUF2723 domain-containing protein [Ignavibacteriales bacterium]